METERKRPHASNKTDHETKVEQLTRAIRALPSADQFMKEVHLRMEESGEEKRFVVPYLRELHRVIHELLPKPNRGLWEPGLVLDRELLSYFALYYQNEEMEQKQKSNDHFEENRWNKVSLSDGKDQNIVVPNVTSSSSYSKKWSFIRSKL
jgi:hypothetical protein